MCIGILGFITSILLAVLVPDSWIVAIIVGMFSCTSFILATLEGIHKTILEKNN